MAKYIFPYERQSDYKGRITFHPIVYNPPQVNTSGFNGSAFDRKAQGGLLSKQFSEDEAFTAAQETLGTTYDEVPRFISPAVGEQVVESAHEFTDYTKGVQLYLPMAFQVNDQMQYEQLNLGAIGASAEAAIRAGSGAASALARGVQQGASSMVGLLTGTVTNQRAARLAAVRLAEAAPIGDAAAGAVSSALGVSINPNTRALFRSVALREFAFTFTLIASSANEADEIERIVRFFREEAYPDAIKVPGGQVAVGYEFPNKFLIKLDYNGVQVGTKILPSFLRGVQVTYNPNNMGFHRDGKPSEVTMTLNFGESRTLSKDDIKVGY